MLYQRTVKARISGAGIALHSGQTAHFAILPAAPDSGIVFVRTDQKPQVEIPARAPYVVETRLATTLGRDGVTVGTVEHLLAALFALGIDNSRIEVDGPEIPIMDGSAAPFVELIRQGGGTISQSRPRRFIVVKKTVESHTEDGRSARLEPASRFRVDCTIDFKHPILRDQRFELDVSDHSFVEDISRARTFGFGRDVEAMRSRGLALGGSVENAIVIDDYSIRNPEGLRFPDEFVRHKVLDAIGDLSLLGAPIIGRFVGHKSGHALNTSLVSALLEQPRAYDMIEFRHHRDVRGAGLELPAMGRLAAV